MRVLPFLFLFAALSLRPALAQSSAKEAAGTPIRYSRDVPKSVARALPRGAKSLFWGTFPPSKGSGLMGVHLFDHVPEAGSMNYTETELEVFERQKQKWQQLKRIPLNVFYNDIKIDAKFFWINPEKTVPLLKLRLFTNGELGPIGEEFAVSSPRGFAQDVQVQSWNWGNWWASDSIGQRLDWSQQDDKGFLQVVCHLGTTLQSQPEQITVWRWNGQRFAPTSG